MFDRYKYEVYFHNPRENKTTPVLETTSFNEARKKVFQIVRDNEKADPFSQTFARLWKTKAGWITLCDGVSYYVRRGWYLYIKKVLKNA